MQMHAQRFVLIRLSMDIRTDGENQTEADGLRPGEIPSLWRALSANEGAVQHLFNVVVPGMTPDELKEAFTKEIRRRGFSDEVSGAAFVVGAGGVGPKLRLNQPLKEGDLWGMDFQFSCNGYYSDIGRYAVLGEPSSERLARHRRILELEDAIAAAIRPGRTIGEALESGLPHPDLQAQAGGHRVGLEMHEHPVFPARDDERDRYAIPGTVMCIEIWAGLDGGIEDEFLVTGDGLRRLTTLPRELVNTL
jgi:Xaa-Pro aminopeptidase